MGRAGNSLSTVRHSRTQSLLREIDSLGRKDPLAIIEARADHAYSAVRKLEELMRENLSEEEATDLMKRFFNATRTADYRKIERGIRRLREPSSKKKAE